MFLTGMDTSEPPSWYIPTSLIRTYWFRSETTTNYQKNLLNKFKENPATLTRSTT